MVTDDQDIVEPANKSGTVFLALLYGHEDPSYPNLIFPEMFALHVTTMMMLDGADNNGS